MVKETFLYYVLEECERQWKDNQADEYGSWESQSKEQQKEYFDDMFQHLSEVRDVEDYK